MNKEEKVVELEKLKGIFAGNPLVLLCHQSGLTVEDSTDLRRKCRDAGASFRVSKNALLKLAVEGTVYKELSDKVVGPVTLTWSEDPLAAAKVISDFLKENENLKIIAGANPDGVLSLDEIQTLAKTPPLEVLRARIVGLLVAPASALVGIMPAVAGNIARVIAKKPEQKSEAS